VNPPTGGETNDQADVFELLADKGTYECQVKHLKKGKKPGPDDVPNELLKILPESMHTTIHALFQIMWLTGITPQAWKESVTSLLYKKGDPYLVANFRPIGMAKLWTSKQQCHPCHPALRTDKKDHSPVPRRRHPWETQGVNSETISISLRTPFTPSKTYIA